MGGRGNRVEDGENETGLTGGRAKKRRGLLGCVVEGLGTRQEEGLMGWWCEGQQGGRGTSVGGGVGGVTHCLVTTRRPQE